MDDLITYGTALFCCFLGGVLCGIGVSIRANRTKLRKPIEADRVAESTDQVGCGATEEAERTVEEARRTAKTVEDIIADIRNKPVNDSGV